MRTKYADCDRPYIQLDGDEHATLAVVIEMWTVFANVNFTVPSGFTSDGASIPRFLWPLCGHPMKVPRVYAATAHDFLYSGGVGGVTRAEADKCYYLLLRHFGIAWWRAKVEYWALRLCGWTHWIASVSAAF